MREMFRFWVNVKGNGRYCLWTEPLWGIPFHLYFPFFTIYMFQLGVLDVQIGMLLALGRLVQVCTSLLGGIVTDKFGRNLTTFVSDLVAWSVPMLIWAFAQDFRWFLAAALINSFWQISNVSWECLWIDDMSEDVDSIKLFFNWLYVCGLFAVFFAPIAGFFVGLHGVVPVMRVLFVITFISMTAKFVILFCFAKETNRGRERMEATKGVSLLSLLMGYKEVFLQLLKSKGMLRALSLQSTAQVTILVASTFFALYATQNLGLPDQFLAYFPILRAGVMLAFLFFIQNRLYRFAQNRVMLVGISIKILALVVLLRAPEGNWILPGLYIFLEACAAALLMPRIDTLAANAIDPKERARIRGLFNVIILAVSSPFALLAGFLSDMNRQLPFILNIGLFALMAVFVYRKVDKHANKE